MMILLHHLAAEVGALEAYRSISSRSPMLSVRVRGLIAIGAWAMLVQSQDAKPIDHGIHGSFPDLPVDL